MSKQTDGGAVPAQKTEPYEDVVSYACAEQLKSAGFDEITAWYYHKGNLEISNLYARNSERKDGCISAPTFSAALKWLRSRDLSLFAYPVNSYHRQFGEWEGGACWISDNVSVIFYGGHELFADSYEELMNNLIIYCSANIVINDTTK